MKYKLIVICYLLSHFVLTQDSIRFNLKNWRSLLTDSVIDIDGNIYHQQQIGNQVWMIENLRTTRFNNGEKIQCLNDKLLWTKSEFPTYCNLIEVTWFGGKDTLFKKEIATSELLYNYCVVEDKRNVCPNGWKVPSELDWQILESTVENINLEYRDKHGSYTNSDFKGLSFSNQAFGYRSSKNGEYVDYNDFGFWWVKDKLQCATAYARIMNDRDFGVDDIHLDKSGIFNRNVGFSIKCIKSE